LAGKFPLWLRAAAVILIGGAISGCFSNKIVAGRRQFYAGNYAAAGDALSKIKDKGGKDHILALLEYGASEQAAGNYKESTAALLDANKLIEAEVVHLGQQAGSLVTNKMITTYRPESFETVLLHTYLAMDYMMVDEWSDARVEAKQALGVLDSLDKEINAQPFARYVCGLAFDVMGDQDDAYIEYSKAAEAAPEFLSVYYDLHRLASAKGMGQEARTWAREIEQRGGIVPKTAAPPNLIVFVGAGRSPIKKEINIVVPPNFNRFVVPDYVSSRSLAHHAVLSIGDRNTAPSYMITDLDPLAEKALKKRIAKEIAMETARVAAKEVIAEQISKQNGLLGLVVRVAFFASEAADVRSWQTLPRYFGVIADTLPPGEHEAKVQFYTQDGSPIGPAQFKKVTITEGRRTVLIARSVF